jgi:hypothetical protein
MPTAPAINPNDIMPDLEQRHRDAMLDLVLAWGSLDGALGMLLSCVQGLPLDQGAEQIGKRSSSAKLEEVCKVLQNTPGGVDAARILKKHKKNYERYSRTRNRIAHSRCEGVWTRNRDFIVFMVFEKVEDNELALYATPIQEMQRATRWGRVMEGFALKLADAFSAEA